MNEAAPPVEVSPTPTPAELGAQMARLREQFNLSQQEVSERLHIRPRYVSAIEEGRYDLMPGKVYARGYVHTYAEFLGMDAEKIVAQCFVGESPANAQPIPPIAAARHSSPVARLNMSSSSGSSSLSSSSSQWRGYAVMGAVLLVLVLIVSQFMGRDGGAEKQEASVAPVPEAMLASVRNMVMPLPNNYLCLTTDNIFECFNADQTTHLLGRIDEDSFHYGGAIDVSSLALAPPAHVDEAATEVEEKAEAENPDSPAVSTAPADEVEEEGPNLTPPHDE